jgi:hypothetical protein
MPMYLVVAREFEFKLDRLLETFESPAISQHSRV